MTEAEKLEIIKKLVAKAKAEAPPSVAIHYTRREKGIKKSFEDEEGTPTPQ